MYVVGVSIPNIFDFLKILLFLVFFGKSFMCFSIARLQCFGSNLDLAWIWLGSGLDLAWHCRLELSLRYISK